MMGKHQTELNGKKDPSEKIPKVKNHDLVQKNNYSNKKKKDKKKLNQFS